MNEPWLAHYDAGVPKSIGTYPDRTLAHIFAERAQTHPDQTAIVFKSRRLTYAELDRAADAFAGGLAALGVRRGDRVALVLPNCPQFIIATLAVWRLAAVAHYLNPIYTPGELEEALATMQAETVIVLTPFYAAVKKAQSRTAVRRIIATNIKEYLPPLLRVLFTIVKEKKEGHRIAIERDDFWFADVLRNGAAAPVREIAARPEDAAAIMMSGGTTGTPKGVLAGHRNLIMAGTQLGAWLAVPLSIPNAATLLPLPLFHIYGLGAWATSLIKGTPLILVPNPRDLDDVVTTIDRQKPTVLCGVPTLFNAILNHPKVAAGRIDFSSLYACFSGAAALMAETKKRFEDVTGARIVEGYSLTESIFAACANPLEGTSKTGSVGVPISDIKVRIVDAVDSQRELPAGETGEIVMIAPQLMVGYWNNPEETAKTLRVMADGVTGLYTGDLGYLDSDGYLFLVDRKKDLIKTSGLQVWPREVEEVIATHPAVSEVGVAGLPDARKGEIVAAWVVPRAGRSVTSEELRAFCRGKLAPFKVPSRVEIRSELPKSMVGKVLRRALVAEAKAALAGHPSERGAAPAAV